MSKEMGGHSSPGSSLPYFFSFGKSLCCFPVWVVLHRSVSWGDNRSWLLNIQSGSLELFTGPVNRSHCPPFGRTQQTGQRGVPRWSERGRLGLAHNKEPNTFTMAGKSHASTHLLLTSPETRPSASVSSSSLFLPLPGDWEGDGLPPRTGLMKKALKQVSFTEQEWYFCFHLTWSQHCPSSAFSVLYGTFNFLEHLNVIAEGAPAVSYSEIGQDRSDRGKVDVNLHWGFPHFVFMVIIIFPLI